MSIESVGYTGDIDEVAWAQVLPMMGGRHYGVLGGGDWKVTAGTADREVRIAPGTGFGPGILDRTTTEASLVLPAPASGSRWHLIAVRRDWQNNESVFDSIGGSTGTAQIPARETTPGTKDDQPLALVRVQAGQSQVVEIRDLRVWGGDGGSFAADELVLQFLSRLGTRVRISGVWWTRVLDALGNPQWSSFREPSRGVFVGATENVGRPSPAGTVTVAHDLGVTPTAVIVTDRNAGAVPASRKVVLVVANAAQIQFAVYNNGSLLVNNPVEFGWAAFA